MLFKNLSSLIRQRGAVLPDPALPTIKKKGGGDVGYRVDFLLLFSPTER